MSSITRRLNIVEILTKNKDRKKKNLSKKKLFSIFALREKCPKTEFFLVRIFPH